MVGGRPWRSASEPPREGHEGHGEGYAGQERRQGHADEGHEVRRQGRRKGGREEVARAPTKRRANDWRARPDGGWATNHEGPGLGPSFTFTGLSRGQCWVT